MWLTETQDAFLELASNSELAQGVHTQTRPRIGQGGVPLGEIPFDPSRHSASDINVFSLMGEATGQPYVSMVMPRKDVAINVVTDFGQSGDNQAVANLKHSIGHDVTDAIEEALPSITDRLFRYSLGDVPAEAAGDDYESLREETEEERVGSVKDLCLNGLTVVVSGFQSLPLHKYGNGIDGIAIKVTHPLELPLAPGQGVVSLGGGYEVKTNKPKQLAEYNQSIEQKHQTALANLRSIGLQVVEVVYNPSKDGGYDGKKADSDLAKAVEEYANAN